MFQSSNVRFALHLLFILSYVFLALEVSLIGGDGGVRGRDKSSGPSSYWRGKGEGVPKPGLTSFTVSHEAQNDFISLGHSIGSLDVRLDLPFAKS